MHFGVLFKQLCDHAKAVKYANCRKSNVQRHRYFVSFEAVSTVQFFF